MEVAIKHYRSQVNLFSTLWWETHGTPGQAVRFMHWPGHFDVLQGKTLYSCSALIHLYRWVQANLQEKVTKSQGGGGAAAMD